MRGAVKHLGPYILASVWVACITACVIAGKDDAAGVMTVAGIFAAIVIGAAS